MPTTHVEPTAPELLQEVADGLLKARKVVVVTGAGISTNSGIPVCCGQTAVVQAIEGKLTGYVLCAGFSIRKWIVFFDSGAV